ncbi:emerin (Emery-Dreifuss muscular dystrophy) isoform X1 [Channa argus]|uniref:emerin (Emery-Dreifuss muscular dystrophy) isoform X1 n=1 Tax=Channa argus TaxID=215402 RepID=UPI00352105AA
MPLSEKSNEEISKLLAEFGIKHGPIVDSTRKLYEKKLEKAMETAPVKPSSDKTFYREEGKAAEEEITYITYRSPIKQEGHAEAVKRRFHNELDGNRESDHVAEPPIQFANRTANHSVAHKPIRKSGGSMWKVVRLLLLLAVLAAALYYAYIYLINNAENPFGIQ